MPKVKSGPCRRDAAEILQLEKLLERKPKELSGGQRQRVAIGRAIVREPEAFLFDEPLSNLDAALRVQMRMELARLHKRLGKTMIYVTHDQVEAMTLADKIVVFNAGAIQQQGSPLELYEAPCNLFVATFIGSPKMNVVPCEPDGGALVLPGQGAVPAPHDARQARPARLGVRPEHIHVVPPGEGHATGRVEVAEHLGADTFLYVNADALGLITVRTQGTDSHRTGEPVGLAFEAGRVHFFDDKGHALGVA